MAMSGQAAQQLPAFTGGEALHPVAGIIEQGLRLPLPEFEVTG